MCPAEDSIKGRALTLQERYAVVQRAKGNSTRHRKDLPDEIELAVGMRVMVTSNIETDLDVANGARGEIVDMILHPDETVDAREPVIRLKHPPSYILVKLHRTRASRLEGLDEHVIPVEPMTMTMQISIATSSGGKTVQRSVRRKQYPMMAAYTFTDYRSQGQTIPKVIVDIHTPPGGKLTLFNLYVALSRSSGRGTIRLLRDFDGNIFRQTHDHELQDEDERLGCLNDRMKSWWQAMGRAR